jgi:hypothetical protein
MIGAVCACDAELANCIAVKAVVASSTRRSFVMMIQIPGKVLSSKRIFQRPINSQPLGRIVAGTKTTVFLFRAHKR